MLLLLCSQLVAQVRQEQDLIRTFFAQEGSEVIIANKYGEVIIETWNLDSVRFEVLVRAEGKSSAAVAKSMDRVNIRFNGEGKIISAKTQISSGGGFFGNVRSEVEGVVGNNRLKVNYRVWLPSGVSLKVGNKFGDLYLADMKGDCDLDVSHGDIKAGDFDEKMLLKHSFGKASLGRLSEGVFSLRASDIELSSASGLEVQSGSSQIRAGKVGKLKLTSRNDKIFVDDLEEVIGEGSFTNLSAGILRGSGKLNFTYGDILIERINKGFDRLEIRGKSTDINLIVDQASYIQTEIRGKEDRMLLPNSMLSMQKDFLDDQDLVYLSGFVGNTNTKYSQLDILADGGELIIAIKETPIFVDRE